MNNQIRKPNDRKRQRQLYVNRIKFSLVAAALALAGTGMAVAKNADANDFSMDEISREISIHTGHEFTEDGSVVSPYLKHGCEVPIDEEKTPFIDRLVERMSQQYSQEVIEEVKACYEQMYYGNHKDAEEAKDRLDEIDDMLEKGEDGLYHMPQKNASLH